MLLSTKNPQVERDLKLLTTLDPAVVEEFCKIATQSCFFPGNVSEKVFSNAASRLGVDAPTVSRAIDALAFLAEEAAKLGTSSSPDSLETSLGLLGFGGKDELLNVVAEFCRGQAERLKDVLTRTSPFLSVAPRFKSFDWRLQIPVASRLNLSASAPIGPPVVILRLLAEPGKDSVMLQASPRDLVRVLEKLEDALREARSWRTRKVLKALK